MLNKRKNNMLRGAVSKIPCFPPLVRKVGIGKRVQEILDSGFRIHYHVWTQKEMAEMFVRLAEEFGVDLEIEAQLKNRHEVIFILRKQPSLVLRDS